MLERGSQRWIAGRRWKSYCKFFFFPTHYRQEALIEYYNVKQGDKTVEEFIEEFDRLRMRCDVAEEDEQTIARYLAGLRYEIFDVVQL